MHPLRLSFSFSLSFSIHTFFPLSIVKASIVQHLIDYDFNELVMHLVLAYRTHRETQGVFGVKHPFAWEMCVMLLHSMPLE